MNKLRSALQTAISHVRDTMAQVKPETKFRDLLRLRRELLANLAKLKNELPSRHEKLVFSTRWSDIEQCQCTAERHRNGIVESFEKSLDRMIAWNDELQKIERDCGHAAKDHP